MNKLILSLATVLLITGYANAQTKAEQKQLERTEKELKRSEREFQKAEQEYRKSLKEYDEIVIKRKDRVKDAKVLVEIRDDEVIIDGQPLEEFVNDEVSVRLRSPQVIKLDARGNSPFTFSGEADRPFLGVMTEGSTEGTKIITVAENSAAAKAGLKIGDIIIKINGKPIYDHEQLTELINQMKPEALADIEYKRQGKSEKAVAVLGKRQVEVKGYGPGAPVPPVPPMPPMPPMGFNFDGQNFGEMFKGQRDFGKPRIGIKAQDTEDGKGVKILDVDDESAAQTAGMKEDDIITSFDGKVVNSAEELARASRDAKDKSSVEVILKRDGKSKTISLKIPKKLKTAEL